ncbi:MAG TPA: hypothetical protein VH331_16655 [Allosphingosinicella sp.]|nr:hypothetical protein [Allosphingosinicella sp.]
MKIAFGLAVAFALVAAPAAAQQEVDTHYRPKVEHPAYSANGPVVAVDEGHRNFHTLGGRYAPFGKLLTADGYRVQASSAPFSSDALKGVDVLVIANALPAERGGSAFSDAEIAALKQWVQGGGSLLLISDHAPFGRAASALAAAFGVDMGTGYAVARQDGKITANIEFSGGALGAHPILHGRDKAEQVRHVKSFTGQSLGVPAGGTALLTLPDDALEVANERAIDQLRRGDTVPGRRVGARAQALAFTLGKGRVVVAGEAAMFSAQIVHFPGGETMRMGLWADDDEKFALNVLHWLTRLIP